MPAKITYLWKDKYFPIAHRSDYITCLGEPDGVETDFWVPKDEFWFESSPLVEVSLWDYRDPANPAPIEVLTNVTDYLLFTPQSYYEARVDIQNPAKIPNKDQRIRVRSTIAASPAVKVDATNVGMNVTWSNTNMNGFLQWQVCADPDEPKFWEGWQDINNGGITTLDTAFGGGFFNALTPNSDFPWLWVRIVYDGGGTINGTSLDTTVDGTITASVIAKGEA